MTLFNIKVITYSTFPFKISINSISKIDIR